MDTLAALKELALDVRWSWNHRADSLWKKLDGDAWELTHNPWVILQTVSNKRLEEVCREPEFEKTIETLQRVKESYLKESTWFQNHHSQSLSGVAYFSMEFMLSEALPIYSGGLGNVAGDQMKAASDLGVPVIGIGLLYSQGYFRQTIDKEGNQIAIYPYNDPSQLPIQPLRDEEGEWIRIEVRLPGQMQWVRVWKAQIGRAILYLLDSNDPSNDPIFRGITSELYGGNQEIRLKQELILGLGGWRLLEKIGQKTGKVPEVCHLNEGHAAFAILERITWFMRKNGVSFDEALAATRPGNLFTTHTAVAAGFDSFSASLLKDYLGFYVEENLHVPLEKVLGLGRINPDDPDEPFHMAYLGVRGSGAVNGVSLLHGKVSRHLFNSLFDRWPPKEVPVGSVTNGIHTPSWDSAEADDLWERYCGASRWLGTTEQLEGKIRAVSDVEIWQMRQSQRKSLIEFARERLIRILKVRCEHPEHIEHAKHLFSEDILTLGFARRFAPYKRPNLLLHDPERFLRILTNQERPVQLILAGKAHPADNHGKELIKQWMQFILNFEEARAHVIFLTDYDMLMTERLVQGADVWINTPRRPWEACGTSGMKVLVNGGLNLSELDGWWAEAYDPKAGWALGDGQEHDGDPAWDAAEAGALYDILEQQIIPEFYNRDARGIPVAWTQRIRESMARYTPLFSTNRAVREYTEKYYIPAAARYRHRTEQGASLAKQIVSWQNSIRNNWMKVQFGALRIEGTSFEAEVFLGELSPEQVRVELFANGSPPLREGMKIVRREGEKIVYRASVSGKDPLSSYTPRIIPYHPEALVPLEAAEIRWQR